MLQVALVLGLLVVWLASETVRASGHLAVLFLYSFPSEFLVGLVPHEPVLIFFGALHPAWVVAGVAGVSTVMAEALNYSVFGYFYRKPTLNGLEKHAGVRRVMDLFQRRAFAAILFAGFTPVPFFPIRLLVVMTRYPLGMYLLGVALSRTPRFLILAAVGSYFRIPSSMLVILMGVMLVTVNIPALVALSRDRVGPVESMAPQEGGSAS